MPWIRNKFNNFDLTRNVLKCGFKNDIGFDDK